MENNHKFNNGNFFTYMENKETFEEKLQRRLDEVRNKETNDISINDFLSMAKDLFKEDIEKLDEELARN